MKLLSILFFILLAGTCLAFAQKQTFTAAKIEFDHLGPYSRVQLEAVAGMHAGTEFTAEDLDAAAQRLADTGFLGVVGATTAPGRIDAITVLFDINPLDRSQMLHLTFENFVWLTPDEIQAALQTKAPLFLGYAPQNTQLLDEFNDALTDALAKKGIQAKVMHDAFEPSLRRPEIDVDYWIAKPALRVADVKLTGVSTNLVPLIQKSVNSVAGKAYSDGLPGGRTSEQILLPLLDAGYIDAALSDISVTPSVSGDSTAVVVAATLHSGEVYHVSGIVFAGCPLLSADAFAASAKLHAGDVANRAQLLETLEPLDTAYRREGYADVIVRAKPKEDSATHQVAYTVTVTPGEQYHIKTVVPNGLAADDQGAFDSAFAMKVGGIYNPEYLAGFLKGSGAWQGLAGYSLAYKAYADPDTHTVDLVLNFARGGVQQNVTVFGGP